MEKELSEKNVYENIIEFGITNFEKSSSGVNKANEIITNIYTDNNFIFLLQKLTFFLNARNSESVHGDLNFFFVLL
jgi:hypothetical protein